MIITILLRDKNKTKKRSEITSNFKNYRKIFFRINNLGFHHILSLMRNFGPQKP